MRKTLQREQDRENQRRINAILCSRWGTASEEKPIYHPFDFFLSHGGRRVAAIEVKARVIGVNTYKDIILSENKVNRALRILEPLGIPLFFVAEFTKDNAVMWFDLYCPNAGRRKLAVRTAGRTWREDPEECNHPDDMEPCVIMPKDQFRDVSVPWYAPKVEFLARNTQAGDKICWNLATI